MSSGGPDVGQHGGSAEAAGKIVVEVGKDDREMDSLPKLLRRWRSDHEGRLRSLGYKRYM